MIAQRTHIEQRIFHQNNATSIGEVVILIADDFRRIAWESFHAGFFYFEKVAGSFPWWRMEKLSCSDLFAVRWDEQRGV